jgi:glutaredoxin
MSPRVTLYERAGCHLCEEARHVLDRTLGPGAYARVDIDADDDLVVRYGFRVPVIAVDGIDRLEAPMTVADLRHLVERLA